MNDLKGREEKPFGIWGSVLQKNAEGKLDEKFNE